MKMLYYFVMAILIKPGDPPFWIEAVNVTISLKTGEDDIMNFYGL
jgi:hypothetical protein